MCGRVWVGVRVRALSCEGCEENSVEESQMRKPGGDRERERKSVHYQYNNQLRFSLQAHNCKQQYFYFFIKWLVTSSPVATSLMCCRDALYHFNVSTLMLQQI